MRCYSEWACLKTEHGDSTTAARAGEAPGGLPTWHRYIDDGLVPHGAKVYSINSAGNIESWGVPGNTEEVI